MVHTYTIYIRLISLPGEITYALFRSACNIPVHDPGTTVHILELSSGTLLKPWDLLFKALRVLEYILPSPEAVQYRLEYLYEISMRTYPGHYGSPYPHFWVTHP